MNEDNEQGRPDRIKRGILNTLLDVFREPDFDNEGGVIQLLNHDDTCLQLGLFPTDDDGETRADVPTEVWTIEVARKPEGAAK